MYRITLAVSDVLPNFRPLKIQLSYPYALGGRFVNSASANPPTLLCGGTLFSSVRHDSMIPLAAASVGNRCSLRHLSRKQMLPILVMLVAGHLTGRSGGQQGGLGGILGSVLGSLGGAGAAGAAPGGGLGGGLGGILGSVFGERR